MPCGALVTATESAKAAEIGTIQNAAVIFSIWRIRIY